MATIVEVGTDQTLRAMLMDFKTELDANRKRIAQVREKIAPLMQCLKRLTPQQKEKATELLYEADELEVQTEQKLLSLTERSESILSASKI